MSFLNKLFSPRKKRLNQGLYKSKRSLFDKLKSAFLDGKDLSTKDLEKLEEILISSDLGVSTSLKIIERISKKVASGKNHSLHRLLSQEVLGVLESAEKANSSDNNKEIKSTPHVVMVVGVNGVGKTTTIAKLAAQYTKKNLRVLLGAGDTFRAAATEQLSLWADKLGVKIIKQDLGADPASVAFDTLQSAVAKKVDVVLIDTAGRLHNKKHLMAELEKIQRVMKKVIPEAPHEILLVLDGATGQNALQQAKEFSKILPLTGLAITKLDGTSKGGIVIAIADQMQVPIRYIGVGEQVEDLQVFEPQAFVESLFSEYTDQQEEENNNKK